MKKIIMLMIISIVITTGCEFNKKTNENFNKQKEEIIYQGDTASDITMTIKEGTLTNRCATVVIKDLSGKNYFYGKGSGLYKKKGDSYILIPSYEESIEEEMLPIAYGVNENGILEFNECWTQVDAGEYKLVKSAGLKGDNKAYTFSVDFIIE